MLKTNIKGSMFTLKTHFTPSRKTLQWDAVIEDVSYHMFRCCGYPSATEENAVKNVIKDVKESLDELYDEFKSS